MADLIDREFIKGLGGECIARRDRETGELIAITGIDLLPSAQPEQLGTDLAEVGTDCISRQAAIDAAIDADMENHGGVLIEKNARIIDEHISALPSAQPERTCVNCGRTANNGGWYADGKTRCPIEEHYALPKDGYCHLWEKRNVTDDDYPERREK